MEPQPTQVAATVAQLFRTEWPHGIEEATPWLKSLGIDSDAPRTRRKEDGTEAWDDAAVPSWGNRARAGWSTYRDHLADVNWWLWGGAEPQAVNAAAMELADELSRSLDDPAEVTGPVPGSFGTWFWNLDAHTIEMYSYSSESRSDGATPTTRSIVQLSISLRAVADPCEKEARRRHAAEAERRDEDRVRQENPTL